MPGTLPSYFTYVNSFNSPNDPISYVLLYLRFTDGQIEAWRGLVISPISQSWLNESLKSSRGHVSPQHPFPSTVSCGLPNSVA